MNSLLTARRSLLLVLGAISVCALGAGYSSGQNRTRHIIVRGNGKDFSAALFDAISKCGGHTRSFDKPVDWRLKEVTGKTSTGLSRSEVSVALEIE